MGQIQKELQMEYSQTIRLCVSLMTGSVRKTKQKHRLGNLGATPSNSDLDRPPYSTPFAGEVSTVPWFDESSANTDQAPNVLRGFFSPQSSSSSSFWKLSQLLLLQVKNVNLVRKQQRSVRFCSIPVLCP